MLPPFIIEQIRQREEQERAKREDRRPHLELPIERRPVKSEDPDAEDEDDAERGVVIVDLLS